MCVGHTRPSQTQRYTSPENGGRPVATNPIQAQEMRDQFQGARAHHHKHRHHRHGAHNGSGPGNQGAGPVQSVKDMVSGIVSAIKRYASPSNPNDSSAPPATARPPTAIG
jgi:hypothetical protein